MLIKLLIFAGVAVLQSQRVASAENYASNIVFYGYNSNNPTVKFVSGMTADVNQTCDPNGLFAFVVHGWNESSYTPWCPLVVQNLLKYRGGCVFVMDYNYYAKAKTEWDYLVLINHFAGISAVLLNKIKSIGRYNKMNLMGFSYGSRLCQDVGLKLGYQLIDRMDLCDPAKPYFNMDTDPKPAAKNVACINTSTDKGTTVYNCHQNFRMGNCSSLQAAAGPPPMGNHGLCPYFYNSAFTANFVPNNHWKCISSRMIANVASNVMMGYRAVFDRAANQGDVFIATAKFPPYVVVNGVINNAP